MSAEEVVDLIHQEDRNAFSALKRAGNVLTKLIEAIEPKFSAGGRLVYLGAGTSGRLGVLDASEAPPTFQTDPGRIVGIIAGGERVNRRPFQERAGPEMIADELLHLAA